MLIDVPTVPCFDFFHAALSSFHYYSVPSFRKKLYVSHSGTADYPSTFMPCDFIGIFFWNNSYPEFNLGIIDIRLSEVYSNRIFS